MATLTQETDGPRLFDRRPAVVDILCVEPDLAAGIPADELPLAQRAGRAAVLTIPKGAWTPPTPQGPALGHLVLDGLLARLARVGRREALELVAPGDIVRPWAEDDAALLECETSWEALTTVTLADLDGRFARAIRPWPELHAGLMDRALRRVRWQVLQSAVAAHPAIEERLILLLCHLGERLGRVTPDGVVLDLPLSHRMLSYAVRALRPSVTTGLLRLRAEGHIVKREGRRWLITPSGLAFAESLCAGDLIEA